MAMRIEENYDRSALSYAQQVKEEQLDRAGKGAERGKGTEAERAAESQSAAEFQSVTKSKKATEPQSATGIQSVAKSPKEPQKAQNSTNAPKGIPAPRDEYISSEKAGKKPSGLYHLGQDEDGRPKVYYDDPRKTAQADGKGKPEASGKEQPKTSGKGQPDASRKEQPKADGANPQEPEEKCIGSTDKVDREIRQLKEKKQQLEQQISAASGDEKKVRELEQKLAQVENELSRKDNDTYRRQNTSFVSA